MSEEDDYSKLPLEDKLVHKVWKVRVQGYEEVCKLFRQQDSEKSPVFSKYVGFIKGFITDANAVAQEKGLDAALCFIENATVAERVCADVVAGVVVKCLNARPKSKSKGMAICLSYIEIEQAAVTVEELLKGVENKQPKIVAGCLETVTHAINEFGVAVINIKPVIKALPNLFNHSDKTVREQAKLCAVELFRWIRDAVKPALQGLKPVQLKELEGLWEAVTEPASPTRLTRSQQAKLQTAAEPVTLDSAAAEASHDAMVTATAVTPVDPHDLVDAVEVLSKLPADFYENVANPKWQIRKEVLDNLLTCVQQPKLESGDYSELVRALRQVISKDTNVMIVTVAGRCVESLARGLRKNFQPYATAITVAMLDKFKEKKQNVVSALRDAVDAVYQTTSLAALLEDVLPFLENKNPSVKAETLGYMARSFLYCTPAHLPKATLKQICPPVITRMDDTSPQVREAASEALATILKIVGDKLMSIYIEGLDKGKEAKVREASAKVELKVQSAVKAKPSASSDVKKSQKAVTMSVPSSSEDTSAPKSEEAKKVVKKRPKMNIETAKSKKETESEGDVKVESATKPRLGAKPLSAHSSLAVKPAAAKGKRGGGSAVGAFKDKPIPSEPGLSSEEIEAKAQELVPAKVLSGLANANWKERLAACEQFKTALLDMAPDEINSLVFVHTLAGKKPGWKDSNFQVMKARFDLVALIAQNATVFGKRSAACVVPGLVDKLADVKIKPQSIETLMVLSGVMSLNYVSLQVSKHSSEQKSPKVQAEALSWLGEAIKAFSLKIEIKPHIDYVKTMLAATNPAVRGAAISLLGVMHMYMGSQLRMFLEDEKPALLSQIDAEFARVADTSPPNPTRGASEEERESKEGAVAQKVSMADLMPRTDVSGKFKSDIIKGLGDKNWKVRAENLTKVSEILSAAKFITPALGDLPPALKGRLSDSNKNLVVTTLEIVSNIATAMGSPVAKYLKAWGPGVINVLSDGKPQVRSAAIATMNKLFDEVTLSPFIETEIISNALTTDNPNLKTELLHWLEEKLPEAGNLPPEFNLIISPVISCLEDRNSEVRKRGQTVLPHIMSHVGYTAMAKAASRLKPASKQVVMAVLEKSKQSAMSSATVAKAEASAPSGIKSKGPTVEESKKPGKSGDSRAKSSVGGKTKQPVSVGSVPASKAAIDEDSGPPLVASNKEKRHRDEVALKVLKWNFTAPRDECTDQLKDQLQPCCSKTLFTQLFHADFKQHLAALATLSECVGSSPSEVVSTLDLILKWITLRFFDTNTTVLVKCLELLQTLFSFLSDSDYQLLDFEAACFLPYLIMKVGDPKDVVRKHVRQLLRLMCNVYPSGKMYNFIHDGLKSKNARQRAECLEEMGCLIARYGTSVCQPTAAKALPVVAQNIGDRDSTVRTAALNALVEVYRLEGDKIYKLVGQLSDKDMSLLEERIKRSIGKPASSTTAQVAKSAVVDKAGDVKQSRLQSPKEPSQLTQVNHSSAPAKATVDVQWDIKEEDEDLVPPPLPSKATYKEYEEWINLSPITYTAKHKEELWYQQKTYQTSLPSHDTSHVAKSFSEVASPSRNAAVEQPGESSSSGSQDALSFVISQISSDNMTTSRQSLKQVQELLRKRDQSKEVVGRVDQIVRVITLQVQVTVNTHLLSENSRVIRDNVTKMMRHLANTLSMLFGRSELAQAASRSVLHNLLRCMITLMLNENMTLLEESAQITRSLNSLVLKVIDNSNGTHCFGALFQLMSDNCGGEGSSSSFVDLIMKCLWRMAKALTKSHHHLNIDQLFFDVHQFLTAHPPPVWATYASDMPLRTVKTFLHRMAELRGKQILDHLALIPDGADSYTYNYLAKSLKIKSNIRVIHSSKKPTRSVKDGNSNGQTAEILKDREDVPVVQVIAPEQAKESTNKDDSVAGASVCAPSESEEVKSESLVTVVEKTVGASERVEKPVASGSPLQQRRRDNLTPWANLKLGEIFTKIGSKENTVEGLNELYEFKRKHPNVKIDPFMQRTSKFFQTYIERNLKRIERERQSSESGSSSLSDFCAGLKSRMEVLKSDSLSNQPLVDEMKLPVQAQNSVGKVDWPEDTQLKSGVAPTSIASVATQSAGNMSDLRKRLDRVMASTSTHS
ncbi:cytoskeleton-associated protein 5-like isoform X2 [Corticium candelabrum]|uniref:cytoskeleton-associated protein 5-like isoform X2 n=1 Tax=Corticium candelabrum TaxID=121492 RepID=UPI002E265E00|nr:cytoskeleton-associated protein 5-like isoform X2 [Corticium candelabrum]